LTKRPPGDISQVMNAPNKRDRRGANRPDTRLRLGPVNIAVLAAGLILVTVGYLLLDRGSVSAAPLLLVAGYCVCLPAAILLGWRRLPD